MSIFSKLFSRKTAPPNPENTGNMYYVGMPTAGVPVDEVSALNNSVVWACTKVITESLSCSPWEVFERHGENQVRNDDDPADYLLRVQPNPETTAFSFWESIRAHALLWGNGYAEIERNRMGEPLALWIMTPDTVTPKRDENKRLYYEVTQEDGGVKKLKPENVYHLRGLGFDGLVGYSVIRAGANSFSLSSAMETYGGSFFGNGATPGGIIYHEGPGKGLDAPGVKNLLKTFNKKHKGAANAKRVEYLDGNLKFQPMSIAPEEAQFLASRQFQVEEICRWFRMPPHKIAHLLRSTFNNIEEQNIDYGRDTLQPWAKRSEEEADIKLVGRSRKKKVFTKMNLDEVTKGDFKSRTEGYKNMSSMGVYTINDVLRKEGENTIGPVGDLRLVPMNMVSADQAQKTGTTGETRTRKEDLQQSFTVMFEDVFTRLRTKEKKAVLNAYTRQENYGAWLLSFYEKHETHVREALEPATRSLMSVMGRNIDIVGNVKKFAQTYCDYGVSQFSGAPSNNQLVEWVDCYAEDAKAVALTFIEFIVSKEEYELLTA